MGKQRADIVVRIKYRQNAFASTCDLHELCARKMADRLFHIYFLENDPLCFVPELKAMPWSLVAACMDSGKTKHEECVMDRDGFDIVGGSEPVPSDYLPYLEDDDNLAEEQRLELLGTLFNIMKSFVMMGYGMEPVDKLVAAFQEAHENGVDLLESDNTDKASDEEDSNE